MTWYLDGVNLSSLAWNVKNRGAGWSVPGKSGENIQVPGRDGAFWVPNKTYDEGRLYLSMWAAGCNEDGTLPNSEDGRKKVRDNLDRLTSLFSASNRLLTLRQTTGTELALVNELSNPTMTSSGNAGQVLARNSLVEADRQNTSTTEVSRNINRNPYMRSRSGNLRVISEDLYPDPENREDQYRGTSSLFRSYYYPIQQNASTYNRYFEAMNGFSVSTAANTRGRISIARDITFPSDAIIGSYGREVWVDRQDATTFFMQMKLYDGAPSSSVNVLVQPAISYDGVTWTNGTTAGLFNINKTGYTWLTVPVTNLPAMTGNSTRFFVRYQLRIVGGSTWTQGRAFDVLNVAIQDAPKEGNPWRGYEVPAHMIVGEDTPYVSLRAPGDPMSWTDFARPRATQWTVVNTGDRATTAPHAFALAGRNSARDEGLLSFTVFGGTRNTFRRTLPAAQHAFPNVRLWGRCSTNTSGTTVGRVTRRTGSSGSYTYTTVATVNIQNQDSFVSPSFAVAPGEVYCVEFDVPTGDNGLESTIVFSELHVSNGEGSTNIPAGSTQHSLGAAVRAYFNGTMYRSTITASTFSSFGIERGLTWHNARYWNDPTVDWPEQIQGIFTENGVIKTEHMSFADDYEAKTLTVRLESYLDEPQHLTLVGTRPSSVNATLRVEFTDASKAVVRTQTATLTGIDYNEGIFQNEFAIEEGEEGAFVSIEHSSSTHPFSKVLVSDLHVMVNVPSDVLSFSGSGLNSTGNWPKTLAWVGTPFFSESTLSASIPQGWDVEEFAGFDPDNRTIRFTGDRVRVPLSTDASSAYVGYRRGVHVANMTVSAQPEGAASPTSLGTLTSSVSNVQANVTIPSGATYIDFIVTSTGAHKTLRDVYAITDAQPVFPIPTTSWVGFTPTLSPSLILPQHPSSLAPLTATSYGPNRTLQFTTGAVSGWQGPVLSGGYLQLPSPGTTQVIASNSVPISGGYVSVAARLLTTSDAAGRITVEVQGATAAQAAAGTWETLASQNVTNTSLHEVRLVDTAMAGRQFARIVFRLSNVTSPLTRGGIVGIVDGATLTPSPVPLGSNFPGHFVGVRGSDGSSTYQGNIRQCHVEVVESIDMTSMAYGTIAEFSVAAQVPAAFWEDVYDTESTVTSVGSGTSGQFFMSDFRGATAPMRDVVIEVSPRTGSNLTQFTLKDLGSGDFLTFKSASGQSKVTINTELATVANAEGSLIKDVVGTGSSNILSLTPYNPAQGEVLLNHEPGTPVLEWEANTPIKVTVTGRRKYLIG